ncbi:MAG: hypothetical protein JXB19_08225 [Bacteroidales bacterium]|nr:hypothetical protein [Bacteroidales bacterium]
MLWRLFGQSLFLIVTCAPDLRYGTGSRPSVQDRFPTSGMGQVPGLRCGTGSRPSVRDKFPICGMGQVPDLRYGTGSRPPVHEKG